MWREGVRLSEAAREGRVVILCWRRSVGWGERGLRREDILHAVPLVCVMVLKGCVLVLLTVMIVGVELNSPLSGSARRVL